MRPRAKTLVGSLYWPMRVVSRALYGKQKPLSDRRVGYVPCWNIQYDPDSGTTRHCRKPKNHADDCAYW